MGHQVLPTNSSEAAASPSLAHRLENTLGVGRGSRQPPSPHQSGHSVAVWRMEPPSGPSSDPGQGRAGTGHPACNSVWFQSPGARAPIPAQPRGVLSDHSGSPGSQKSQENPGPCTCQRREPRPPRPPLSKHSDRMSLLTPGEPVATCLQGWLLGNRLEMPEEGVTSDTPSAAARPPRRPHLRRLAPTTVTALRRHHGRDSTGHLCRPNLPFM